MSRPRRLRSDEPQAQTGAEPAATPTETPDPREQAKQELRELTFDWLAAAAKGDGATLCKLLAPSEQRHFDRRAGRCEDGWQAPDSTFAVRSLKASRPGQIIVYEDGYATIEVHHARDGEYLTLYAIEEDGRWGMARKKRTGL